VKNLGRITVGGGGSGGGGELSCEQQEKISVRNCRMLILPRTRMQRKAAMQRRMRTGGVTAPENMTMFIPYMLML